ncbi:run domain Beclin-1-interacting and cysteine-rich domain-containing protein-like isoform X2 [Acanthaster planci]|uniref:Run domain Beclin-1-interacting and cysteine-rich domain-containing protein-like isoform X2 n=1 Tax=Acanthaster planci TaxID=133434 RepID=A0A8B7YZ79_ACAPL|nr:run domain Beclin-1-interacting and cysteine-rich domain-containing protein-like isoform X2 [Acanthaster planci]
MSDEQGRHSRLNENDSHQQHQQLLWGLKFTVEGLLAAHTTNVWSTYGGLTRLCNQIDKVMRHGLKQPKGAPYSSMSGDYWDFVMGLRRLQPVLAPSVDRLHRRSTEQGMDAGSLWLHTSLEAHTLSSQLRLLVDDKEHLSRYYHDDAFLCSEAHFKALYICLQSVEQNNASLLADMDPMLLQDSMPSASSGMRRSSLVGPAMDRSSVDQPHRRKVSAEEIQPPAFASPKTESVLSTSDEHARPDPQTLKRHQSESARTMLLSVLGNSSPNGSISRDTDQLPKTVNDPLMNLEFPTRDGTTSPPRRKILRRARTTGDLLAPSSVSQNKEPKLPFEYSSSPQAEKLLDSLGSSPLESLHEEDSTRENCQCNSQPASLGDSTNQRSEISEVKSTDLLSETTCSICGKKRRSEMSSVSKLLSRTSSSLSPPQAKGSMYTKSGRPLRHSQTSLSLAGNAAKTKRLLTHSRSQSDHAIKPPLAYMAEASAGIRSADKTSNSLPAESHLVSPRRNSLLDSGAISPATECYFPQPAQGQSLMSFLSSRDFERIPELDRENAHFSISEAIIAAVEQIRCKQQLTSVSDHESDASDEEIQHLKQRIRLRRNEKRRDKLRGGIRQLATLVSENRSDSGLNTLTSSASTLASSSSNSTPRDTATESGEDSSDTDSVEDLDLADPKQSNLQSLQAMGLSTSLASLYSDADIARVSSPIVPPGEFSPTPNSNMLSAESVALCLLSKFPAKQLPAASELQWLVSEQDAPQALLPMPKSLPVSPDDGENADIYTKKNIKKTSLYRSQSFDQTRLRGNADWAPPRAQIIFNVHPPPKRKVLVAKQNYRCAGCGMRIERGSVKRLRYCEYLGKYFCHCCHSNSSAAIPGRILRKWDFQKVPVCNFARELLEKMHEDPLFNVMDINPSLYRRVKSLNTCRELRMQLFFLKDFLKTCRLSQSLQATYESQPRHLLNEPHLYSLSDIYRVRGGEMETDLTQLVEDAVAHVSQCQLCQAKGFICELCSNDQDIIFPFQLLKTYQCQGCWACYHKTCFLTVDSCPKCIRKNARKISRDSNLKGGIFSDEEDGEQATGKR